MEGNEGLGGRRYQSTGTVIEKGVMSERKVGCGVRLVVSGRLSAEKSL